MEVETPFLLPGARLTRQRGLLDLTSKTPNGCRAPGRSVALGCMVSCANDRVELLDRRSKVIAKLDDTDDEESGEGRSKKKIHKTSGIDRLRLYFVMVMDAGPAISFRAGPLPHPQGHRLALRDAGACGPVNN